MKKLFLSLTILFLSLFILPATPTFASSTSCTIIYGGGQVCPEEVSFRVKKLVQTAPKSSSFTEDDLSINDKKFPVNEEIKFKIVIENTGTKDINDIKVIDTIPQFVNFVSGPGTFNASAKTLTFNIDLPKGATHTEIITGRVTDASMLPQDKSIVCVINSVRAEAPNGAVAEDSIQFCIEKKVLGLVPTPQVFETPSVTTIPTTGAETIYLAGIVAGGIGGLILRKRTGR